MGNFATPHPQYYKDTALKAEDTRAPDYPGVDTIASVVPAARKRGIRTILWAEDVFRNDLPNIDKLQEYDVHGRRGARLCFNNPNVTNSDPAGSDGLFLSVATHVRSRQVDCRGARRDLRH